MLSSTPQRFPQKQRFPEKKDARPELAEGSIGEQDGVTALRRLAG